MRLGKAREKERGRTHPVEGGSSSSGGEFSDTRPPRKGEETFPSRPRWGGQRNFLKEERGIWIQDKSHGEKKGGRFQLRISPGDQGSGEKNSPGFSKEEGGP